MKAENQALFAPTYILYIKNSILCPMGWQMLILLGTIVNLDKLKCDTQESFWYLNTYGQT